MDRRQFQSNISWKKNQWFDELFKRNSEPSPNPRFYEVEKAESLEIRKYLEAQAI